MGEAELTTMARGGRGVTIPDESYAVGIPDIAPRPIEVPSPYATLWFWAHLFRRTLRKEHADNVWEAWGAWISTKPEKPRAMFIILPIEARRVIMERQVDLLLDSDAP